MIRGQKLSLGNESSKVHTQCTQWDKSEVLNVLEILVFDPGGGDKRKSNRRQGFLGKGNVRQWPQ